jgi:hypothetical protein
MRRSRFVKIDYSMFSSYLGRSATVIVFAFIILLALLALFLEENDVAHMPVVIGVYAFDSLRAAPTLEAFADFAREQGIGDIRWTFSGPEAVPQGCDLYLMTSLQASPHLADGRLGCALIVTAAEGRRYSRGIIVAKAPVDTLLLPNSVLFTSPYSASGYLAPYRALVRPVDGLHPDSLEYTFAGRYPDERRVALGVICGAYDAGGISREGLSYLEQSGIIRAGELAVVRSGQPLPELVLAADRSLDDRILRSFQERLPSLIYKMPGLTRVALTGIGIAGFAPPRPEDRELLEEIADLIPPASGPATGAEEPGSR